MADIQQGTTANNYHRLLRYAFAYRRFRPRPSLVSRDPVQTLARRGRKAFLASLKSQGRAEPLIFDDEDENSASHSSLQREITYPDKLEDVIDAGEHPEEHAVIRNSLSVPSSISERPLLDRLYRRLLARKAAIANQRRFWWEISTLPMSSIAEVLKRLINAHLDDPTSINPLAALAYVALVSTTGQDPDKVAEMELLRDWSPESSTARQDHLFFLPDSYCLAYPIDPQTLGYYQGDTPDFAEQCCPTSPWVILPLYPIVARIIRLYLNERAKLSSIPPSLSNRVFLLADDQPPAPLTTAWVNVKFKGSEAGIPDKSVTVQRLAKSLLVHLTTQFGLDPLLACYLSGKVPFHLRAQMFYTHISVREFRRSLSRAINKFTDAIRDEFERSDQNSYRIRWFWLDQRLDGEDLPKMPSLWEGTGSRCVMTSDAISTFFASYREQLEKFRARIGRLSSLEEKIVLFNLVIIHNYIIYQFATGLRPLKDPPITAQSIRHINTDTSRVILRDKRNIRFSEAREVPHAEIAHRALGLCADAIDTISALLRQEGIWIDDWWQSHHQPYFFLLTEAGQPQHLSPSTMAYWLGAVEGLALLYLVPKNAPRHFLRSSLFKAGFSLAFIDRIMGHMHTGHEPTSVLSATALQEADKVFITHVSRMAADLGLTPVPYSLSLR